MAKSTKAKAEKPDNKGQETAAAAHEKKGMTKESAEAIIAKYDGINGTEVPKELQEARKFLKKSSKSEE